MAFSFGWVTRDVTIHWRRDGNDGRLLVLLHEMGGSVHSFDSLLAELTDSNCSFLRIDQRGFGLSEKPRSPYAFASLADDLVAVLDQLDIRSPINVIGVAAGAAIAADLAIRFPERVSRLILCAPALNLTSEERRSTLERAEAMMTVGMVDITTRALDVMYPDAIRGCEFDSYKCRFLANDPVGLALATQAFGHSDLAIERLCQPTLLLAGHHDIRPVDAIRAVTALLPNASVREVPAGGHIMAVQAPGEIAKYARSFFSL